MTQAERLESLLAREMHDEIASKIELIIAPMPITVEKLQAWGQGKADLMACCVCPAFSQRCCRFHNGGQTVTDGPHNTPPYALGPIRDSVGAEIGARIGRAIGEGLNGRAAREPIEVNGLGTESPSSPTKRSEMFFQPDKTPKERLAEAEDRVNAILANIDDGNYPDLIANVLYKVLYARGLRLEGIQPRIERLARG